MILRWSRFMPLMVAFLIRLVGYFLIDDRQRWGHDRSKRILKRKIFISYNSESTISPNRYIMYLSLFKTKWLFACLNKLVSIWHKEGRTRTHYFLNFQKRSVIGRSGFIWQREHHFLWKEQIFFCDRTFLPSVQFLISFHLKELRHWYFFQVSSKLMIAIPSPCI